MSRQVVPLTQLERRAPEAGRIRLGVKGAKGAPKSIDHFRFTSPYSDVIDQLARLYGGTPRPWHDDRASPKDQFEVLTTSNEISVYLIPGGMSIWMEEWSGGGCLRRCDGIMCETPQYTGEDMDLVSVPCMCVANNRRVCDPHTRLQVVIPELSFRGVWRLETKGWNAAHEMPGMVDMITDLGERGQMVQALLGIERRNQVVGKRTRNFVVPRVSIGQSVHELQRGGAAVGIGSGVATPRAALGAGTAVSVRVDMDDDGHVEYSNEDTGKLCDEDGRPFDDVVDAEIIDDELVEIEGLLEADAVNFGLDPRRFVEAIRLGIGATGEASPIHRQRMREASRMMRDGLLVPLGITASGRVQWPRSS